MMNWILGLNIIGGFHKLAWAQRISYGMFFYAAYINYWAYREPSVDRTWRRLYGFKAVVCTLAWIYYTLVITEAITVDFYVGLARWLQPLIILCLFTSAQLHKWEVGSLREQRELKEKLRRLTERDDD
jgi:hypothetical protein